MMQNILSEMEYLKYKSRPNLSKELIINKIYERSNLSSKKNIKTLFNL